MTNVDLVNDKCCVGSVYDWQLVGQSMTNVVLVNDNCAEKWCRRCFTNGSP